MTDRFRDRLSEYRDGELDAADAELVRSHLETCRECEETLAGLEAVARRAAALPARGPEADLWPRIAERIATGDAPSAAPADLPVRPFRRLLARRFALTVPQMAAAALTLASLSAAGAWIGTRGGGSPMAMPPSATDASGAALVASGSEEVGVGERYGQAIADLERTLFDPTRPLPPETEMAIRRALTKIDRAIEDARAALEKLPGDPYLQQHVTSTMRRKAEFLQRAVRLSES